MARGGGVMGRKLVVGNVNNCKVKSAATSSSSADVVADPVQYAEDAFEANGRWFSLLHKAMASLQRPTMR